MDNDVWRLLDLEYADPFMNMAVEEAIARKVGEWVVPNTIRFWRNPNTVVIGRFQCVAIEANLEVCSKYEIKIVRRFTGGGAVYHDLGNLNYAIFLHRDRSLIQKDAFRTFKFLSQGVICGLKSLGANAQFKSMNEIQIDGLKISGAAGALQWGVVLYHGSILVNTNLKTLSRVLTPIEKKPKSKYVRSIKSRVINLNNKLTRPVSILEVKEALKKGFEETFSIKLIKEKLTEDEWELARNLYEQKYSTKEWNYKANTPDI